MSDRNGGPAFPEPGFMRPDGEIFAWPQSGMTLRDYFAAKAPVTFEVAVLTFGSEPDLYKDIDRAAFMAVWTMLRYEYADAMLEEGKKR